MKALPPSNSSQRNAGTAAIAAPDTRSNGGDQDQKAPGRAQHVRQRPPQAKGHTRGKQHQIIGARRHRGHKSIEGSDHQGAVLQDFNHGLKLAQPTGGRLRCFDKGASEGVWPCDRLVHGVGHGVLALLDVGEQGLIHARIDRRRQAACKRGLHRPAPAGSILPCRAYVIHRIDMPAV